MNFLEPFEKINWFLLFFLFFNLIHKKSITENNQNEPQSKQNYLMILFALYQSIVTWAIFFALLQLNKKDCTFAKEWLHLMQIP